VTSFFYLLLPSLNLAFPCFSLPLFLSGAAPPSRQCRSCRWWQHAWLYQRTEEVLTLVATTKFDNNALAPKPGPPTPVRMSWFDSGPTKPHYSTDS